MSAGKLTEARRAWEAACRAWSQDTLDQIEETMRLGEVMMFAATDLICALEDLRDKGRTLSDTLNAYGFPVSDEAWRKSSGSMSIQAPDRPLSGGWQLGVPAPEHLLEFIAYRPDAGVFPAQWHYPAHPDGGYDEEADPVLFTSSGTEDLTGDMPTMWMPLPPSPDQHSAGGEG